MTNKKNKNGKLKVCLRKLKSKIINQKMSIKMNIIKSSKIKIN